jgi:hypothetical protein
MKASGVNDLIDRGQLGRSAADDMQPSVANSSALPSAGHAHRLVGDHARPPRFSITNRFQPRLHVLPDQARSSVCPPAANGTNDLMVSARLRTGNSSASSAPTVMAGPSDRFFLDAA